MDIERFRGLIAVQQAIGQARGDLPTVMNAIVGERSVMPQSNGIVVELRDGDQLYYAAASGTSADLIGLRLPLKGSLSGQCILDGVPLHCIDSETDPRVNLAACQRVGLRSMIVVPIPHQGQTVGVLKFYAAEPDAFDEQDILIAHLLVGPIAVGFSSVSEADAIRAKVDLQTVIRMKEQLVSTVSHELRTPVTSIAGSLALLGSGAAGALSGQSATLVSIASRNAERLKRLINDLLDVDRMDSGRLTMALAPTDLCDLLRTVVEEIEPYANETDVRIILDVPPEPVPALVDTDRLCQAVTNLVSNAAKFSPRGTCVRVSLDQRGGEAHIRVADEGPGIPDDFRSRLFDRFSQSAHTQGATTLPGSGLGLAIAKGIVEQLGGSIRLDESVEAGAAFEIRLPLAAEMKSPAVA